MDQRESFPRKFRRIFRGHQMMKKIPVSPDAWGHGMRVTQALCLTQLG